MTRFRSAAAVLAACALAAVLTGCGADSGDTDEARTKDSAAESKDDAGAPPDAESTYPLPTLTPPNRPPSDPSDVIKGKRVTLTGTVVQKTGGCTMLQTPDRGAVVLVDGRMGAFGLGNGKKVEIVAVVRPMARTGCGEGLPAFAVEQAKPL